VNGYEKYQLISISIIIILVVALAVVAVTYPKSPPDGTLQYKGWTIYLPTENSTSPNTFIATKTDRNPIYGVDLLDILADIAEAER
jgi:hypothetical protein